MISDPTLLVVDDEQIYCDGCERVFSRQGFRVEGSNDATEALGLATRNNYSAILLDIKMPNMDGIRFLERLRAAKSETPVILMTGYPSIQNAASAVRLGASDYVTKPFTPEEITSAVRGLLDKTSADRMEATAEDAAEEDTAAGPQGVVFHGRGWAQLNDRTAVRVGGVVPRPEDGVAGIQLPRVGEMVHQGLPLFAVRDAAGAATVVPSPVSGMVVDVNSNLRDAPDTMWMHPCGLGWVAKIAPTRLDTEEAHLVRRNVLTVTAEQGFREFYRDKLSMLGCTVHEAGPEDMDSLTEAARTADAVLLDAASCREAGPSIVAHLIAEAPCAKIVVVAPSGMPRQEEYRRHRLFYYAVPPLEDAEILDIIDSCCRQAPGRKWNPPTPTPHNLPISDLRITTRDGSRVTLLAPNRLLRREAGLGLALRNKLLERLLPLETGLEDLKLTRTRLLRVLDESDRVIVLTTSEMGRIPGALARYQYGNVAQFVGIEVEDVVVLAIQPSPGEPSVPALDPATTDALAEHIIGEMLD